MTHTENTSKPRSFAILAAAALAVSVAACSPQTGGNPDDAQDIAASLDPLEGFNRIMHQVNKVLDTVILRPVAYVYRSVFPQEVRGGVHNVLTNLMEPVVFLNSALQGDSDNAGHTLGRFILNSTLGVAGIFDIASEMGVPETRSEDFGQTLGYYGAGPGFYLELPILGPTTGRDLLGRVVDYVSDPFADPFGNWLNNEWKVARNAATIIDFRDRNYKPLDDIFYNSIDSYASLRSIYLQRRDADIRNGAAPAGSLN